MARRGYRFIAPVEGGPKPAPPPVPQPPAPTTPWGKIAWMAIGALATIGPGLWLTHERAPLPPPRVVPLTTFTGSEHHPTFSPDGKRVLQRYVSRMVAGWAADSVRQRAQRGR